MADSDGEFVADDGSDDELVGQPGGSTYGTRGKTKGYTGEKRKKAGGKAAWEDLQRSWDVVVESVDGTLSLDGVLEAEKRRRVLRDTTPIQRGIIRHLVLVVDMSFAMAEKDLLPTRHRLTVAYAIEFVREFFDQNPISQLAIVGMRDSIAVRISDMSGNPADHIEKLRALPDVDPSGSPSLQNALEMCRGALFNTPSHGTREVLVIFGALLSLDPGDIHETIDGIVADRIRVNVIGLSAQVYICEEICRRTNAGRLPATNDRAVVQPGGEDSAYNVAMHELHFRELLLAVTRPPVTRQSAVTAAAASGASLLMMGFPSRTTAAHPTLCACHSRPARSGFACTRCGSRVCRLPAECPACGLTLILSTHLARSYHHLFPLRSWAEVPWADAVRSAACFACHSPFPDAARGLAAVEKEKGKEKTLAVPKERGGGAKKTKKPEKLKGVSESGRYMCTTCRNHFCIDCDVFAHEVIHNCPGCQSDTRDELAAAKNGNGNGVEASASNGAAMVIDS